uniref:Uncharacterized protein n=1 Tax=uncultured organism TaxID=155900 RepID=M1QAR7_9ZZZZ|nr:hypothetical protein FLSS-8_0028 [uncultured organism]
MAEAAAKAQVKEPVVAEVNSPVVRVLVPGENVSVLTVVMKQTTREDSLVMRWNAPNVEQR